MYYFPFKSGFFFVPLGTLHFKLFMARAVLNCDCYVFSDSFIIKHLADVVFTQSLTHIGEHSN